MRTHRVGSLTLGVMLITFGILFLLSSFTLNLSYEFIFKLCELRGGGNLLWEERLDLES